VSSVTYDGKKLIPAPFININKEYIKNGSLDTIGTTYKISVIGTLFAYKGSPDSSGTFWQNTGYPPDESILTNARLNALLRKQEALRSLFSVEGKYFEVQSANGGPPLKFRPRVLAINFDDGIWVDRCTYNISLECDSLSIFGQQSFEDNNIVQVQKNDVIENLYVYLQSASESYDVEFDQDRNVFLVSHQISAQGKNNYIGDSGLVPAYDSAKNWVLSRLGITDEMNATHIWNNNFSLSNGYNYNRVLKSSKTEGNYEVNESWIFSNRPYTEQYNVDVTQGDGPTQVNIQGEIQGLAINVLNTVGNVKLGWQPSGVVIGDRYANALTAFSGLDVYNRALSVSKLGYINPVPTQFGVTHSPNAGSISYSYSFNTSPPNIIPGARFENITINDSLPSDVFAIIPVLGRAKGPIIQSINTYSERRRTLTIEVALTGIPTTKAQKLQYINFRPDYSEIVNAAKPTLIPSTNQTAQNGNLVTEGIKTNPQAQKIYVEQNVETWDVNSFRGTKNITWVYTPGPG